MQIPGGGLKVRGSLEKYKSSLIFVTCADAPAPKKRGTLVLLRRGLILNTECAERERERDTVFLQA